MIPTVNTDQVVNHTARVTGSGRRLPWFFPGLSGMLLAVLLVGFAPSFFCVVASARRLASRAICYP
jgi:hypothetical protein